ncbi:8846_t:CDS:2 [Rhizophagus irregularis]|nr:8846_t:CDS:2 [Rhizophagus irregularis]
MCRMRGQFIKLLLCHFEIISEVELLEVTALFSAILFEEFLDDNDIIKLHHEILNRICGSTTKIPRISMLILSGKKFPDEDSEDKIDKNYSEEVEVQIQMSLGDASRRDPELYIERWSWLFA